MPFIESITEEKTIIGFWKLEESAEYLLTKLDLSAEEEERFQSFTCERRKREFLASRVLLNKITGGTRKIVYDNHGRPFLSESNGYISLSHSGSLAAVILSDTPAGIDVEEITRNIERIMPRFLSDEELSWIQMSADSHQAALISWCAKEAIFKMKHQESVDFRRHIHLNPFETGPNGTIQATVETGGKLSGIKMKYRFIENNAVIWCVE